MSVRSCFGAASSFQRCTRRFCYLSHGSGAWLKRATSNVERFDVFTPSQSTSSVETPMANPGEYDFTNVWAPPTPGALERGLETPDRRRRRRRRVDPVEEQAQEESEARRRNEENEEAAASSSAPAPRSERDLLIQMVQQMHQQSMAQNQLILDLQTRLDRMERDRQQAVRVVPVVAPPPPPTGESFACRGLDKSWSTYSWLGKAAVSCR